MIAIFPGASRIGFGCASLGSRFDTQTSLKALHRACEAGVNWFDLAPSYGDGEAESIFRSFAASRRHTIHICTKIGLAPPSIGAASRWLRPVARRVALAGPALRRIVARARPAAKRVLLTPAAIQASLDSSLLRLGVDHVDVVALHDPSPHTIVSDETRRALEDILKAGKARVAGIAGGLEATEEASSAGLPVRHFQFAMDLHGEGVRRASAVLRGRQDPPLLVTHSVASGVRRRVALAPSFHRTQAIEALRELGYDMPASKALYAAGLDLALADNPCGIILASMVSSDHLQANLQRLDQKIAGPRDDVRRVFDTCLSQATPGAAAR